MIVSAVKQGENFLYRIITEEDSKGGSESFLCLPCKYGSLQARFHGARFRRQLYRMVSGQVEAVVEIVSIQYKFFDEALAQDYRIGEDMIDEGIVRAARHAKRIADKKAAREAEDDREIRWGRPRHRD